MDLRRQHIKEQLAEDYAFLKQLEERLRNEDEPRQRRKYSDQIKEVEQGIRQKEQELNSLSKDTGKILEDSSQNKTPVGSSAKPYPDGSKMKRRSFLGTIIGTSSLGLASGYFVGRNLDNELPDVEWTMISFLKEESKNMILYKAPQMLCKLVSQMSNKRFIIEIDIKRKIDTDSILKEVSEGKAQCGYGGIYYNSDKYYPLYFSSAIPFGLNPQQQNAWLYYKAKPNADLTYMQQLYQKLGLNVIPFPAGATGAQMGGWFKNAIRTKSDLSNLRMRIPGLGAKVLERFGVIPTNNATFNTLEGRKELLGDLITRAFKEDKIDAAEWIGPHDDLMIGLDKAGANYYYYPGWWEPGTTFEVQVNLDVWKNLKPYYQEIFKAACYQTHMMILAEYDIMNREQLQEIYKLKNIQVKRFSQDILDEAQYITEKVLLPSYASSDDNFKQVYQDWNDFRYKIQEWHKLAK